MKPAHRRVVEVLEAGGHLYRPGLGEKAYRLFDPSRPGRDRLVREATIDEMFDAELITRAYLTAPIHLVVS